LRRGLEALMPIVLVGRFSSMAPCLRHGGAKASRPSFSWQCAGIGCLHLRGSQQRSFDVRGRGGTRGAGRPCFTSTQPHPISGGGAFGGRGGETMQEGWRHWRSCHGSGQILLSRGRSVDVGPIGFPNNVTTSRGPWPGPLNRSRRGVSSTTPNPSRMGQTSRIPMKSNFCI
jgi:hypothetical protein